MAGRPRKVVAMSKGKIGKEARKNRQEQEEKNKLDRDELEKGAPEWLDETAAAEYTRVVKEAGKIDLWDNLDQSTLAIYADNYSRYIQCVKAMSKSGMVLEVGERIIPSPYMMIADKAATQIQKCSTKLGLATTDRLKLIAPTKEEIRPNKFDKFLGMTYG